MRRGEGIIRNQLFSDGINIGKELVPKSLSSASACCLFSFDIDDRVELDVELVEEVEATRLIAESRLSSA